MLIVANELAKAEEANQVAIYATNVTWTKTPTLRVATTSKNDTLLHVWFVIGGY